MKPAKAFRKGDHTAARERLTVDQVVPRKAVDLPAHLAAHAEYQAVLQRYFRGLATSAEVGLVRIRWCAAESRLVEARQAEVKANEWGMARLVGRQKPKAPRQARGA